MQIIQSVVRDLEGNQLKKQEQLRFRPLVLPLLLATRDVPRNISSGVRRREEKTQIKQNNVFGFSLSRLVQPPAKVKGRAQRIFLSIFRMDFPFLFAERISLLLFLQFCPFH